VSTSPCFLVEWYQPDLAATTFDDAVDRLRQVAGAGNVRLLGALTAPSDETIFGVLAADSAEAVVQACQQAGWHTDRVTPVTRADISA
jgi:hypothetical protein